MSDLLNWIYRYYLVPGFYEYWYKKGYNHYDFV